jgi:hypothetical protein
MLQIHFSRDSVCAGDDIDPHDASFAVPTPKDVEDLATSILRRVALPRIAGGQATWCLSSRVPFAVVAQQWSVPKSLWFPSLGNLIPKGINQLKVHASYFVQQDPDEVFRILARLTLPQ